MTYLYADYVRRPRLRFILKIALGALIASLFLEGALRIRVGRRSQSFALVDLQQTVRAAPSPYAGSCGGVVPSSTLGQLIRPSSVPDLIFELKPNVDTCYGGVRVGTNAEGLRAPVSFVRPKPRGVYRILLLGDSQTFGFGVEYEQTFGALLEREISEQAGATKVQVINTGLDAYNTVQEAAHFSAYGVTYQPDCVLILFIGNDFEMPEFLLEPDDGLATNRLFLVGVLSDQFIRLKRQILGHHFGARPSHVQRVPRQYRHMVGLDAYRRALRKIAKTARLAGSTVVNIADYQSSGFQRHSGGPTDLVDEQRDLGIRIPRFIFPNGQRYWLSESDHHLNPEGHIELANRIIAAIDSQEVCRPSLAGETRDRP